MSPFKWLCLPLLMSPFLFMNCSSNKDENTENINQEVTIDDELLILGTCNREGLQLPEYKVWFEPTYESYKLDTASLAAIHPKMKIFQVHIILGTWCEDSQREVPGLYKILDYLGVPDEDIFQICVDRSKTKPEDLLLDYNVEYVPTLIFRNNGREVGQIIEMPSESLEKDILGFLSDS